MLYINHIESITTQLSFENNGFTENIKPSTTHKDIIYPDFKRFIPTSASRRMSNLLKMNVSCAISTINDNTIDGIIVATSLGCLKDSETFLNEMFTHQETLSPSSFIQSTHNTIAGQIALILKNHGYNNTHSQNVFSFENALIDSYLYLNSETNMKQILVGATDEYIDFLEHYLNAKNINLSLSSGCTYLTVSKEKTEQSSAYISSIRFMKQTDLIKNEFKKNYNQIIVNNSNIEFLNKMNNVINISNFVGVYGTNSSFGLHYAVDRIHNENNGNYLIINLLSNSKCSIIELESI